jgi:hypothetical protein
VTEQKTLLIVRLDRMTLVAIALGIAVMLQPWWDRGFRVGFFLTLIATVGQIVTSHMLPRRTN